jgi:hypothetical protein
MKQDQVNEVKADIKRLILDEIERVADEVLASMDRAIRSNDHIFEDFERDTVAEDLTLVVAKQVTKQITKRRSQVRRRLRR